MGQSGGSAKKEKHQTCSTRGNHNTGSAENFENSRESGIGREAWNDPTLIKGEK